VSGRREVLVAPATASTFGDDEALIGFGEVVNQLSGFLVVKRCSDRHLENDGLSVESGAVRAHAVLAALRLVFGVVAKMDEGVVALGRFHDDVAAPAAIAARGPAAGHEFLAPEGHA